MNQNDNPGRILDRALNEMRDASASPADVEDAAQRVLEKLKSEHRKVTPFPTMAAGDASARGHIAGCAGFRALIPAYLARSLAPDWTLLWEDHARECVDCRKALDQARSGVQPATTAIAPPSTTGRARRFRMAAVAAAAVILIAAFGSDIVRGFLWPVDAHAMAQTVNGGLYLVAGQEARAITAGSRIERGQAVRSGSDSSAVLELAGGWRVEMAARAELALVEGRDGVKVRLRRGSVIVTGDPTSGRPLYVETPDCEVSAQGTVFTVSAVPRGSRVSVIRGEARVMRDGAASTLASGQQFRTDELMETVSVRDEIRWSPDTVNRLELAGALVDLENDMRQRVGRVGMRFESDLKSMIPAGAVVVASFPNVSEPVAQAYAQFKQRVQETETLRDWWTTRSGMPGHRGAEEMVNRLARLGTHLGPEIVLAFPPVGQSEFPIALAGVKDADSAFAAIQNDLERMRGLSAGPGAFDIPVARNIAELEAAAARAGGRPVIYLDRRWIAVSTPQQILRAAAFRGNPAMNPFPATPLGRRIDQAYTEGVGWLLAADLKQIVDRAPANTSAALGWLGMDAADQLLVEQKTGSAGAEYRATLGFSSERHGVAAWVAAPAPMGALEFISPSAYSAAGAVTRDPALILDDLFQVAGGNAAGAAALEAYQREHRLDIRNDLAAPLGNEFLIALDGPILPAPAWRGVVEVNDAARLQASIENVIAGANRGGHPVSLSSEVVDGRTFYRLSIGGLPIEVHYAFWGGYMVLGPKRTFVMEAMQAHDSGNSLARAPAFRSQLPDGRDGASGFFYQNVQSLAEKLPASEVSQAIAKTGPSVIYVYGEPDRIVISGKGFLGMNSPGFAGLANLQKLVKSK